MFSKKVIIYLKNENDTIHIEPLGDIHVGHVGFDEKHYLERVNAIVKDPNRYTIFMGDQLDAINIYDKRYNPHAVLLHDIDSQRQRWHDLTKPLIEKQLSISEEVPIVQWEYDPVINQMVSKKRTKYIVKKGENPKILGLLHGNHEYKIRELTQIYLENNFCYNNGIDFLGAKCYISLEIRYNENKSKGKKWSEKQDIILGQWSIMAMHGSGGGEPESMFKAMKINNYMDIFFCGHLHKKTYKEEEVMDMDHTTGKAWKRPIYLVNTGTFCEFMTEGVSGYGDTKNKVEGAPIGTATISINAKSGKVNGHI